MRVQLTPETRSFLACTLSNWGAHFCFTLLPLLKLQGQVDYSAPLVLSVVAGLCWVVGIRWCNPSALLVFTPIFWGCSLAYSHTLFETLLAEAHQMIRLDDRAPEVIGDYLPTSELFLCVLTLTAYFFSTLYWLNLSPSRNEKRTLDYLTSLPKHEVIPSPYPTNAFILIYWCVISPLALGLWSSLSPRSELLNSQKEISLALSTSWMVGLISLTAGACWVLLKASPPSLVYLVHQGELKLNSSWRRWAWTVLAVGVVLIYSGL